MSDIVERLRKGIEWTGPTQDDTGQTENLMDEAADEIERLREWNREIALNAREFVAENERLRAALKSAEGELWNISNAWGDEDYRGPVSGFTGDVIAHRKEFAERMIEHVCKAAEAARAALEGK